MSDINSRVALATGSTMPVLGLGVFDMDDPTAERAIEAAFAAGYRMIDTAAVYRNEAAVGRAVRASVLPRHEVYVTTKVWNTDHADPSVGLARSLDALELDYVDLYLIHWPDPAQGMFVRAWEGLLTLREQGLAREIGVSNFTPVQLDALQDAGLPFPPVNQIEFHPLHRQDTTRAFHVSAGIVTQAWSPLARGKALGDRDLAEIAARHGKTVGQVILRWHVQLGSVPIPKSATPSRIEDNAKVFDFELDAGDMAIISGLGRTDVVDDTLYARFG